jgi:hypothetical protein
VPTVLRVGPYRFFFWSHENRATREPSHIHVKSGDGHAIFWLDPVEYRDGWGYTAQEIAGIERLVLTHKSELLEYWHDFFRD